MTIVDYITDHECDIKVFSVFGFTHECKVKFKIRYVSYGIYTFREEEDVDDPDGIVKAKPKVDISILPEWFMKVIELYDQAEPITRENPFIHYCQMLDHDRCMIDMGNDTLFTAYKLEDGWVALHTQESYQSIPSAKGSQLIIKIDDLREIEKKLNDQDNPNIVTFLSLHKKEE